MLTDVLSLTPINVVGLVAAGLASGWLAWPALRWRPVMVIEHGLLAASFFAWLAMLRYLDPAAPKGSAAPTLGAIILWGVWVVTVAAGMQWRMRRAG